MSEELKKHDGVPAYLADIQLDLTQVKKYENLQKDLISIDVVSGPMYMRDFNAAYELVARMVARIEREYEQAILRRKQEEAKAKLERAPKYFADHPEFMGNLKDSFSLRESYADVDPLHLEAKEAEIALQALLAYLKCKMDFFRSAHDDSRKIYDKMASGPFGQSGHQGMPSGGKMGGRE